MRQNSETPPNWIAGKMYRSALETRVATGILGLTASCLAVAVLVLILGTRVVSADSQELFVDVPADHVHGQAIAALAARGWIDGTECDTSRFCPDEPFERWVMAVWLIRAAGEDDDLESVSSRFVDVSSNVWWSPHVHHLAERDITRGCGDGTRFCPTESVTRAQLASFLVRAFQWDIDGEKVFVDTAGNVHEEDIDVLVAEGITAGCAVDPPRYCPNRATTRGEMATFLARALRLIDRPGTEPGAENVN